MTIVQIAVYAPFRNIFTVINQVNQKLDKKFIPRTLETLRS